MYWKEELQKTFADVETRSYPEQPDVLYMYYPNTTVAVKRNANGTYSIYYGGKEKTYQRFTQVILALQFCVEVFCEQAQV